MHTEPEVTAHRGASAYAAEHTLAAYDLALTMGADSLELDVRATADGVPVVLHDPTLLRTAGDPRPVAAVHSAELTGERSPLHLDDVLDRYGRGTRWLVELKDPAPALEAAVVRALRAHGLTGHATVQSFDAVALLRIRRAAPELPVAPLLCESAGRTRVLAGIRGAGRFAAGVGVRHEAIDAAVVRAARHRGLRLRAFTVNDAREMGRLLALGVDGLITDVPDVARAVVAAPAVTAVAA